MSTLEPAESRAGKIRIPGMALGLGRFRTWSYCLFLAYLVVFPFVHGLVHVRLGRVGIDDLLLLVSFALSLVPHGTPPRNNRHVAMFTLCYGVIALLGAVGLLVGGASGARSYSVGVFAEIAAAAWLVGYHRDRAASIAKAFLLGALFAALFAILQSLSGLAWDFTDSYYLANRAKLTESLIYSNRTASVSFFPPNGNFLASYMIFSLLIVLIQRRVLGKVLPYLLTAVYAAALFLSLSFTSIGAAVFACGAVAVAWLISALRRHLARTGEKRSPRLEFTRKRVLVAVIAIAVLGVLIYFAYDKISLKAGRYFVLTSPEDGFLRGMTARMHTWIRHIGDMEGALDYIFGIGYGSIATVDSFVIEIFVTTGLLGLAFYTALVCSMAARGMRGLSHRATYLAGVIIFFLVNLTASYGLYQPVAIGLALLAVMSDGDLQPRLRPVCSQNGFVRWLGWARGRPLEPCDSEETEIKTVVLVHRSRVMHYRIPIYNRLSAHLEARGWRLIVAAEGLEAASPHSVEFEFEQTPGTISKVVGTVRALAPDAVIMFVNLKQLYLFPLLFYLKCARIPAIYWNHGIHLEDKGSVMRRLADDLQHALSDALILYSEDMRQYIRPRSAHKVFVARNTLDTSTLPIIDAAPEEILARHGVHTRRNIICVGRLQRRKRIGDLVEAFQSIQVPDCGLILVGPDTDGILKEIDHPRIFALGTIYGDEVAELLHAADVYCMPGHVGLSIVDAMFYGLPFVTEDVDHAPEIMYLKPDVNGFMVDKGDVQTLASKLELLLTDDALRSRFSMAAKKTIAEEASLDRMLTGFSDALAYIESPKQSRKPQDK